MRRPLLILLALVAALWLRAGAAHADVSPEYKLKAAVLFNFAKFVEWPPKAFADEKSPLLIGVLGDNPFDDALDEIVRGRTINGRPVVVKKSKRVEDLMSCHVLFVSASEKGRQGQILAGLGGLNTLTVSDTDGFLAQGGVIQMKM